MGSVHRCCLRNRWHEVHAKPEGVLHLARDAVKDPALAQEADAALVKEDAAPSLVRLPRIQAHAVPKVRIPDLASCPIVGPLLVPRCCLGACGNTLLVLDAAHVQAVAKQRPDLECECIMARKT